MDTVCPQELHRLASALELSGDVLAKPTFSSDNGRFSGGVGNQHEAKSGDSTKANGPGNSINMEIAQGLKRVLFGSRPFLFCDEWSRSHLQWQHQRGQFPYGLFCPKDKSRGIVMVIQAHILKHLLFDNMDSQDNREQISSAMQVKPSELERRNTIISSLADILWRAGNATKAVVVIQHGSMLGPTRSELRRLEHLVSTLRTLEYNSYDQLWTCLKKRIDQFTNHEGGGILLFLYSLILSRSINKVENDLQGDTLLTHTDQCALPLISLTLTGSATPYLFNGDLVYDIKGQPLPEPLRGIKERCEIGLLLVERNRLLSKDKKQVGSMLKTPIFPIWITYLNGRYSILFCLNGNLNRDWRIEHCFTLHYFNGQSEQTKETKLTVDSRMCSFEAAPTISKHSEEKTIPLVEECILTRWSGAKVNWNGSLPLV
ncbi:inactive ubiquitin carboxyl-terminal hydrolase MINDY-4B-like [Amphiura filiformis]|uniref:inactive ubiquitin carboxyl-terminal hydrolase MINDY-4B-like n=1 Tax=Amphiura filiformis TaxID=82378 RepID=UPI003B214477